MSQGASTSGARASPAALAAPNSQAAVDQRAAAGKVRWDGVLVLCGARLGLSALAQGGAAAITGEGFVEAGRWMTVWASAVDLGCLALMAAFLRREGLRLRDLFHAGPPVPLGRSLLQVPVILLGLGALGFSVAAATGLLLFGSIPPPPTASLPLWAGLYSTLAWPLVWGFTEQLTYNGYCAPRVVALSGRHWLLVLVVLGWGAQHLALPFKPDPAYLATRLFPSLAIAIACVAWYLRTRNLLPFALAHWLIDAGTGAMTLR